MNTAKSGWNGKRLQQMQRTLWIDGSPREGLTTELARAFIRSLPDTVTVERYKCFAENPLPCDDCRSCYGDGKCSKPDLGDFYNALEEADILLFSAPVYNRSFPAPMKALLDRLQRYWVMRMKLGIRPPIAKRKQAVLLTSCGGEHPDGEYLEQQLRPQLTVLHTKFVGSMHAYGSDTGRQPDEFLQAAGNLGTTVGATFGRPHFESKY